MPDLAARSRRARRRGSSHDALHDAAPLQRRAGVRRTGRLGIDGRLAGRARHAVGARARSGDRSARSSTRRSSTAGRRAAASARTSSKRRAGKWQLTPAWLSRDMDLAEEVVVANGVVFAYGAGEDAHAGRARMPRGMSRAAPRYGGGLSSGAVAPRFRTRRTPRSMRSTRRPARSSGRAAIRSRRGITSAGSDGRQRSRVPRHVRRHAVLLRRRAPVVRPGSLKKVHSG